MLSVSLYGAALVLHLMLASLCLLSAAMRMLFGHVVQPERLQHPAVLITGVALHIAITSGCLCCYWFLSACVDSAVLEQIFEYS